MEIIDRLVACRTVGNHHLDGDGPTAEYLRRDRPGRCRPHRSLLRSDNRDWFRGTGCGGTRTAGRAPPRLHQDDDPDPGECTGVTARERVRIALAVRGDLARERRTESAAISPADSSKRTEKELSPAEIVSPSRSKTALHAKSVDLGAVGATQFDQVAVGGEYSSWKCSAKGPNQSHRERRSGCSPYDKAAAPIDEVLLTLMRP